MSFGFTICWRVRSFTTAAPRAATHLGAPHPRPGARRGAGGCVHRRWPDPSRRERTTAGGQPTSTHHAGGHLAGEHAKHVVPSWWSATTRARRPSAGALNPAGLRDWCVHHRWPEPSRRERTAGRDPTTDARHPPRTRPHPRPGARRSPRWCVHRRWPDPSRRERTTTRGQPTSTHHRGGHLGGESAKHEVPSWRSATTRARRPSAGALNPAGLRDWCVHHRWPEPSRRERTAGRDPTTDARHPPRTRPHPRPGARRSPRWCVHRRWPDPSRRERTTTRGQPTSTHHRGGHLGGE